MARRLFDYLLRYLVGRVEATLEGYRTGRANLPSLAQLPELLRRPETFWLLLAVALAAGAFYLATRR